MSRKLRFDGTHATKRRPRMFRSTGDSTSSRFARSWGECRLQVELLEDRRMLSGTTQALLPLGSLIYTDSVAETISVAGETDSITIDIDAGQTVSLVVRPDSGLIAHVELVDPKSNSLASAFAPAAGEAMVLQTVEASSGGIYTINVTGEGSTTGNYSLDLFLNTAIENESLGLATNEDANSAQDIDGSYIALGSAGGQRGAVLGAGVGQADAGPTGDAEDWYRFSLQDGQSTTLVLRETAPFTNDANNLTSAELELYAADGATLLASGLANAAAEWRITDFVDSTSDGQAGSYFLRVWGEISDYVLLATRDAELDSEPNDARAPNAQDIALAGTVLGALEAGPSDPAESSNLISNGSFESGDFTGWTVATIGVPFLDWAVSEAGLSSGFDLAPTAPQDGTWVAWNGFDGDGPMEFVMAQDVFLPVTSALELAWQDRVQWDFTLGGVANQPRSYSVELRDPVTAALLDTIYSFSTDTQAVNPTGDTGWQTHSADLSAWSGQTVRLTFREQIPQPFTGPAQIEFDAITLVFEPDDYYSVEVNAGDLLAIAATLPAAGPGEFFNNLELAVELLDPHGNLVANASTQSSATMAHTALLSGTYTVRLSPQNGTQGEYVLEVSGQTGSLAPFEVVAFDPKDGVFLDKQAEPSQLVLDFSSSLLATSVAPTDLTVDGAAATGVTMIDADTLAFDLPILAAGNHTMSIAAGALTSLQNRPLEDFSSQFTLDFTPPRVISSSIQEGDILPDGFLVYVVQFDEPLLENDLDADVVTLVGNAAGNLFEPTFFAYDNIASKLVLAYDDLPEGLYTLTLHSGDQLLEDRAGNNLDGEIINSPIGPNASGDGIEGGNFVVQFFADHVGAVPIPLPLVPIAPLGSLAYQGTVTGRMDTAQDIDQYAIDIDAGQTITLVVEGSGGLQPTVVLKTPGSPLTATATAPGPNQAAILQAVPATVSGTYLLTIRGAGATLGDYSLQVLLNTAVEEESLGGLDNGSLASAQLLDREFVNRGSLGGSAVAVQGRSDEAPLFTTSQTQVGNVFSPHSLTFDFTSLPLPSGDAILTVTALADLFSPSKFLTIAAEGIFSRDLFVNDGNRLTVATQFSIPHATLAALAADGTISFSVTPSAAVSDSGSSALRIEMEYPSGLAAGDWYEFPLQDHETASVALQAAADSRLELYDASGMLLATGWGGVNTSQRINNFTAGTQAGGESRYFVRVTGSRPNDYSLLIVRNADFDDEANNDSANAQDLGGILGAMGHLKGELLETPAAASGADPRLPSATRIDLAQSLPEVDLPYLPSIASPFLAGEQAKVVQAPSQAVSVYPDAAMLHGDAILALSSPVAPANLAGNFAASLSANLSALAGPLPILQTFAGPAMDGGVPPDPIAAAGPEQLVALVNTQIGIYDKTTGEELFLQSLNGPNGFFGSAGATTTVFDPWILFDTETDRFFAISIDIASPTESNVYLAVSTDATPTGGADWHKYQLDFTHSADGTPLGSGAHFPDYPKLGVSDDAIWISGNYFPIGSGSGVYAGITAIEKDPLLAGGPANVVYEEHFDGFSVMPMTQLDSPTTQYFAESSTASGSSITIHAISDVLGTPIRSTAAVSVPSFAQPVNVPQLGGGVGADSIDARVMTGVWRDGSMWFAHAITEPVVGDGESLVRWYEVSTAGFSAGQAPTLVQSGNVDPGPGEHAWMPAVAVDGLGNLGIGFSVGGTNQYFGAGFTGRLANDPLGETLLPVTHYATGLGNYEITDGAGRNRWGDYSGISVDPADDATFWVFNEYATASNTWATQIASFQLQQPLDEDWHQFAVNAGDILRIETFTPSSGPHEIVNQLDPSIELIDPQGNVVPYANRAGNELVFHVAQLTGQYRLHLLAEQSEGEYFVQIEGATGSSLPPSVIDTQPDENLVLSQFPLSYTLSFSESLWLPSIKASDLVIGGLPALSVTPIDGANFQFQIDPATDVGDGIYSVQLAPGAVADLQGLENEAFSTTFRFDSTGPVILTTLWNGQPMLASGIYPAGPLLFTATFNEDLFLAGSSRRGPFTPGTDDVMLVDHFSATSYTPLTVHYDPATDRLDVTFASLPEGDYELTLKSGDGGLEDQVGNDLDGEPIGPGFDGTVTGDSVPGGDYTVSFGMDGGSRELQSWIALQPLGSLMFASQGNSGLVNRASDQDQFQFFLEGGQTLAAVLTPRNPNALLSLELLGQAARIVASAPGEAVALPITTIPAAALFEFVVGGDTKSGYDLNVYRNAAVETTVSDTDDGNPLAVDSSFLPLGSQLQGPAPLGAGRYGIAGRSDAVPGRALPITNETEPNDDGRPGASIADLALANDWSGSFLPLSRTRYRAVIAGTIAVGDDFDWDFFKILASPGDSLLLDLQGAAAGVGTLFDPYLLVFDNTGALIAENDDFFGLESQITFNQFGYSGEYYVVADSFGSDTGSYQLTGTLTTRSPLFLGASEPDVDFYSLDLSARVGHHIDVVMSGQNGVDFSTSTLELLDATGAVLATATSPLVGNGAPLGNGDPAANFDLGIFDFVVPNPAAGSLYTLRFETERPGEYGIVVTDSIVFDVEPNHEPSSTLRSLDDSPTALGWLNEPLVAQFYGSDRDGNLFTIDTDTGVGTFVGRLANASTEIEFDAASGRAYSQFPNGAFAGQEFDLETGAAIGGAISNDGAYNGLEWIDGELYGTAIQLPGESSELRILNPFVGTSSLIGSTGQLQIAGLAYDTAADRLYGIAGGPGPADLYTIDRSTGIATVVGSTGFQAGSLEFGSDGQLYGGGTGNDAGDLYRIDAATGSGLLVGSTGFGGLTGLLLGPTLDGIVFAPTGEPVRVDTYAATLLEGQAFTARTDTLLDHLFTQPANRLDPALAVIDPHGQTIAFDSDSLDGKNAELRFTAMVAGTYWIQVQTVSGSGTYLLNTSKGALPADFDGDADVDGADFLAWQRGYGAVGATVANLDGDADDDQDVDARDLGYWEAEFGQGAPSLAVSGTSPVTSSAFETALAIEPVSSLSARADNNEYARQAVFDRLLPPMIPPRTWRSVSHRGVHQLSGNHGQLRPLPKARFEAELAHFWNNSISPATSAAEQLLQSQVRIDDAAPHESANDEALASLEEGFKQ